VIKIKGKGTLDTKRNRSGAGVMGAKYRQGMRSKNKAHHGKGASIEAKCPHIMKKS
jgi:hypothetical protein